MFLFNLFTCRCGQYQPLPGNRLRLPLRQRPEPGDILLQPQELLLGRQERDPGHWAERQPRIVKLPGLAERRQNHRSRHVHHNDGADRGGGLQAVQGRLPSKVGGS